MKLSSVLRCLRLEKRVISDVNITWRFTWRV